jgi:hypothetical protein
MIRPFVVEELIVDVVHVPTEQLGDLATLLEEIVDASPSGPARRMLDDLAAELREILLWRLVRTDLLEGEVGR